MSVSRNWIVVASADHVASGRAAGVMQVAHGKRPPLARVQPGDRIVYYSPTQVLGQPPPLQAFTAIGVVRPGEPYAFDMGGGFVPWRRDVDYLHAAAAPIRPLLAALTFARPPAHWGSRLRFGLVAVDDDDMRAIARAMHVAPHALGL